MALVFETQVDRQLRVGEAGGQRRHALGDQQGTLRRLLITPARKATFLLGTITGQVVMALVQMLLLIGFGILVMRLNWGREPLALFVILLASALAAAAFGTTMGTFIKSEGQASGLSVMFGMLFALLGGCWYPLELFPRIDRADVPFKCGAPREFIGVAAFP